MKFDSVSGDTRSDFPVNTKEGPGNSHAEGSIGNSSNKIKINSVSGDLEIKK